MHFRIFLILSCLLLGETATAQTLPPLKSLTVGNFWVYNYSVDAPMIIPRNTKGDYVERVLRTQSINGKDYAIVYDNYTQTTRLERSDANNLYEWDGTKDVVTQSLLWKLNDTVIFKNLWYGCLTCKYLVRSVSIDSDNAPVLQYPKYKYIFETLPKPQFELVPPYEFHYTRGYGVWQYYHRGLVRIIQTGTLAGGYLKGAYIDGVVLRDTNIITSVIEEPPLPLAQSKQASNSSTQAAPPRLSLALSAENPFTSRTQVRYRLERSGNVALAVYNVQGVRLATFAQAMQGVGEHTAIWNGTNADGQDVPAGTYFIVVFVNDRQAGEVKVAKVR